MEEQKAWTKVKDLTPTSKQVNLFAKVVNLGEQKEITPRYGSPRRLVEATIGDETATGILTLWEEQIRVLHAREGRAVDCGREHVRGRERPGAPAGAAVQPLRLPAAGEPGLLLRHGRPGRLPGPLEGPAGGPPAAPGGRTTGAGRPPPSHTP